MSNPLYITPEDPQWAQRLKDDPQFAAAVTELAAALDSVEGMSQAEWDAMFEEDQ